MKAASEQHGECGPGSRFVYIGGWVHFAVFLKQEFPFFPPAFSTGMLSGNPDLPSLAPAQAPTFHWKPLTEQIWWSLIQHHSSFSSSLPQTPEDMRRGSTNRHYFLLDTRTSPSHLFIWASYQLFPGGHFCTDNNYLCGEPHTLQWKVVDLLYGDGEHWGGHV